MASVTTLVPTTVLELSEEAFDSFLEESPVIAFSMMRSILETLRNIDHSAIEDLQTKNEALRQAYEELQSAHEALVEKRRLERELEIAAEVQRSLLPASLPNHQDYRNAAYLEPARRVGGDFYDVFDLDDQHLGILIADVADKSIQAALFMAVTRTLFQVESRRTLSPSEVALAVHDGMLAVSPVADTFVTAFYGVLHRPSGLLKYIIAGHEHPLLARPGQGIAVLEGRGRFLGMIPQLFLEEYNVEMQPGDRLILFSDGVSDAENPAGENYGTDRLRSVVRVNYHLEAAPLVDAIRADIAAWQQHAPPIDDLAILVVEAR
jgi:serine phosphatase RsbU (regulator of sigma subunit)